MRSRTAMGSGVRLLTVLALVAVSLTSGAATASADEGSRQTRVAVELRTNSIKVQDEVDGRVLTFDVSTKKTNGALQVFAPKQGRSLKAVLASLRVQLGIAKASKDPAALARSTRRLTRDAHWYGGVDVQKGRPASFTVRLERGTYYLIDLAPAFVPKGGKLGPITTIEVSGDGSGRRPSADARIEMRGTDGYDHDDDDGKNGRAGHGHEFRAPASMPSSGVVEVRNKDEVIHIMVLIPVKQGTSRQDIADLVAKPPGDPEDPGPFLDGHGASMNALSPGGRAHLEYDLPEGTYVIACFIADEARGGDARTHFELGMFEVVELT